MIWSNKTDRLTEHKLRDMMELSMLLGIDYISPWAAMKKLEQDELELELKQLKEKHGDYDLSYSVRYGHGDCSYQDVMLNEKDSNVSYRTGLHGYDNPDRDALLRLQVYVDAYKAVFGNS